MPSAGDAFRLAHGGEIREALIMLEGEDGGFELLAHGWLSGADAEGVSFALVRSCASNAIYLLLDGSHDPQHPRRWRPRGAAFLAKSAAAGGAPAGRQRRCRLTASAGTPWRSGPAADYPPPAPGFSPP